MGFRSQPALISPEGPTLHVYLLGQIDYAEGLRLQRLLVDEVTAQRDRAAVVLCEHGPSLSVGRQGSHGHILFEPDELEARRWPVRWVSRGGGCFLHLPGQLAVYPILSLDRLGLGLQAYLDRLQGVLLDVLDDFTVHGTTRAGQAGVWVRNRLVAGVGIAVRDWVSWHGAVLNVAPDLVPFRQVRVDPSSEEPMTSLARERHGSPRMAHVRQSLIEHFQERFGFPQVSVLFGHPAVHSQRLEETSAVP